MRTHVYLDPKCLKTNLIPAAIELCHRETSGYLMGTNGSTAKRVKIVSAYPIQTDKKAFTYVEPANKSTINRLDTLLHAMNIKLLGGFHSHPLGPSKLSKSDIAFIGEKAEKMNLSEWLELILSVKKKDFENRKKRGWDFRLYPRKLGFTVVTHPYVGYEVTLSGFWLKKNGHGMKVVKEATLWTNWRREN